MSEQPFPSLEELTRRLAKGNRRVGELLDRLPTLIDEMMAAWERRDVGELRQLAEKLAQATTRQGGLAPIARRIGQRIGRGDLQGMQRDLAQLIGEVGKLRRRGMVPAACLSAPS